MELDHEDKWEIILIMNIITNYCKYTLSLLQGV